jgi:hypothetical protein
MSEYTPQTPRDARAQAKAEKAYRKAQRPFYKKKRFIFPVALVLLIIIGGALGGGSDSGNNTAAVSSGGSSSSSSSEAPAEAAAAFGKAQNGDKMTVTVAQVTPCKKGKPSCTVSLTFKNETNEVQDEFIDRSDVVLVDAQDRRFEAPTAFDGATVQPGGTKRVRIEFTDLPGDFEPKAVEVDSAGAQFTVAY